VAAHPGTGLTGGFVVDDGRDRRLQEQVGALGWDDPGSYLQTCCDAGVSVPQLAAQLGLSDWQVGAAMLRLRVRLAPGPQRLAQQRRRHTQERIAARVAALGRLADVGGYLSTGSSSSGGCWRRWPRSWERIG